MSALVRLYPRTWRDRYESEFLDVLESRPPSPRDRLDIVRGALDARLHQELPGSPESPRPTMQPARLAAACSIVAGAAWLAWLGLVLQEFRGWGAGQPQSQTLMVVLAAIMSLALAATHIFLPLAAQATLRPLGAIAASVAVVSFAATAFGGGWTFAIALIASAVLAATMAGRSLPVLAAVSWAATSLVSVSVMVIFIGGGGQDVGLLALGIPSGVAWIVVGVTVAWRGLPSPTIRPIDEA